MNLFIASLGSIIEWHLLHGMNYLLLVFLFSGDELLLI
ncbi:hypothetical protein CLV83_0329 [Marinobacterium mangrovicola]|uniref:Uncharacterized protein n=1 Tax=Marinobacterium mangrovicola TaxID=1476959 RepID=A0A4R1GN51_9GAMM|nr:hypothetical protein CLV83_0329 [Marinobacterium mangrovicola]